MNLPQNNTVAIRQGDQFYIPPPPPNTRSHNRQTALVTDTIANPIERKLRPSVHEKISPLCQDKIQSVGVIENSLKMTSSKTLPSYSSPIQNDLIEPQTDEDIQSDDDDDDGQGLLGGANILTDPAVMSIVNERHPSLSRVSRSSSDKPASSSSSTSSEEEKYIRSGVGLHDNYRHISDDDISSPEIEDQEDRDGSPLVNHTAMMDSQWRMSQAQWTNYSELFDRLIIAAQVNDTRLLPIHADITQQFFQKSQLSDDELAHIWHLADMDLDGHLSLHEFNVAMHLVVMRKKHYPLPDRVPIPLLQDPNDSVIDSVLNEVPVKEDSSSSCSSNSHQSAASSPEGKNIAYSALLEDEPVLPPVIPPRTKPRLIDSQRGATVDQPQHQPYQYATMRQSSSDQQVTRTAAAILPGPSGNSAFQYNFGKFMEGSASSTALSSSATVSVGEGTPRHSKDKQKYAGHNERRELLSQIRILRQRNHVLLRLNNELSHEYQEIQGQSQNLDIRLRHLQSLAKY